MQARVQRDSFSHDEWLAELKFDGYRVLAATTPVGAALQTEAGVDCTRLFPEVVAALSELPAGHVFDGEICVLDVAGRSRFDLLRTRMLRGAWSADCAPVVFCVFDHLKDRQHDLRHWPLAERKQRLKKILAGTPPELMCVDGLPGDGNWLWHKAREMRFEGIVLKRLDSVYQSGALSGDWLVVNNPESSAARRRQLMARHQAA